MIRNYNILGVVSGSAAGPVEAARQKVLVIKKGILMVHMVGRAIQARWDPRSFKDLNIRASISGFIIVTDDANVDAPLMGVFDFFGDSVVSDGEHADVDLLLRLLEVVEDAISTCVTGAEARFNVRGADGWRLKGLGLCGDTLLVVDNPPL